VSQPNVINRAVTEWAKPLMLVPLATCTRTCDFVTTVVDVDDDDDPVGPVVMTLEELECELVTVITASKKPTMMIPMTGKDGWNCPGVRRDRRSLTPSAYGGSPRYRCPALPYLQARRTIAWRGTHGIRLRQYGGRCPVAAH
jgi:hypothetical protein